jgi:hypothetical protein
VGGSNRLEDAQIDTLEHVMCILMTILQTVEQKRLAIRKRQGAQIMSNSPVQYYGRLNERLRIQIMNAAILANALGDDWP